MQGVGSLSAVCVFLLLCCRWLCCDSVKPMHQGMPTPLRPVLYRLRSIKIRKCSLCSVAGQQSVMTAISLHTRGVPNFVVCSCSLGAIEKTGQETGVVALTVDFQRVLMWSVTMLMIRCEVTDSFAGFSCQFC